MKMSGSKNILWIGAALLVAGCTVKDSLPDTLSGEGKTPLLFEVSIDPESPQTKASNNGFDNGDIIQTYLRHTTGSAVEGVYPTVPVGAAPKLVTLKKTNDSFKPIRALNNDSDDPLYWDDFSNSAAPGTDLRTYGHGLQSYYAYCYNGGNTATNFVEAAGSLDWTVQLDQRGNGFRFSDLLWSREQETVTYSHGSSRTQSDGHTITIPFTHAMSEITVKVYTNLGFDNTAAKWTNTQLVLHNMNTAASLTAPTAVVSGSAPNNITMHAGEPNNTDYYHHCYFHAIVAPDTKLKVGEKLLSLKYLDGNDYELYITSDMVANGVAWAIGHELKTDDGNYILTKPGYNYYLELNVNKAGVLVEASLTDWTEVSSSATGDIVFTNDEQNVAISDANYVNEASFSLFRYHGNTPNNSNYEYATVSTWSTDANKWNNAPVIYWPNKNDTYYFRALAQYKGLTESKKSIVSVGTYPSEKGTGITQSGNDLLWGTTTYSAGEALPPRTGNVPITFRHALSKLTINLTSPQGASNVDLSGATIAVTNLYTAGTINLHDGSVTGSTLNTETETLASAAISNRVAPISDLRVIPQTIGDDTQVIITFTDAVYRLQLNQCKITSSETAIGTWEGGKDYTYTINVAKEAVKFSVQVQDWTVVNGSGNAEIDW
jgi:hypothetical protein